MKHNQESNLRKELGEHLSNIEDDDFYCFDNGFDGHGYTGKQLKENPCLVNWLWDGDGFVPVAVLVNHTCFEYELIRKEENIMEETS